MRAFFVTFRESLFTSRRTPICLATMVTGLCVAAHLLTLMIFFSKAVLSCLCCRSESIALRVSASYHRVRPHMAIGHMCRLLKQLAEEDPPVFLCHFYNIYFAHTAGGRMIGTKVASMILDSQQLNFYKVNPAASGNSVVFW